MQREGASNPDELPRHSMRRICSELLPFLWPKTPRARVRVLVAFIALISGKFFVLVAPFFYKAAVDTLTGIQSEASALPLAFVLAYGAARLSFQIANYVRGILSDTILLRAAYDIRLRLFMHLHSLSFRFHLDRQTGGLALMLVRGTRGLQIVLENVFLNVMPTIIELVAVSVLLTKLYSIFYAAIIIVTICIYAMGTLWMAEKRNRILRSLNTADDRVNTITIDSLLNYETVKYFCSETWESKRFVDSHWRVLTDLLKHASVYNNLVLIQGVIIIVSLTFSMALAAHEVSVREMKTGDFILINTYLLQLYLPLGALGGLYIESKRALVDMEAMLAYLDMKPEIFDKPEAVPLRFAAGEIRFEDVYFGYHPKHDVLKGVSFTIPGGKRVAVVGASGAGKSTITRLLFRFYDVTRGRILIDGQDIRNVTQNSLRLGLGIVPQDTVLFNDTIYYNIAYGCLGTGDAPDLTQVERAAKIARIHDFIVSLPDGYDTRVGERGLKLSGGEKQRVVIARTILKTPSIFIFDEATSALDNKTEAEIQACLFSVSVKTTTLVIAHRLSTIVDADEIIVLQQGEIVERGSHAELLGKKGFYARMWHRQDKMLDVNDTLLDDI
jgi:ATP-binding cassette, subfamily B, heavy metal transporter